MTLWLIRDDKPGHYHQSEGLAQALKRIVPELRIETLECAISGKIRRKILRWMLNAAPGWFRKRERLKYLRLFYRRYRIPQSAPDLILSTGGDTSNLNVWLSRAFGIPNLLNGKLRGLKEECFTGVATVVEMGHANEITLEIPPSVVTSEAAQREGEIFRKARGIEGRCYALLIGGDGVGYRFDDTFYDALARFAISLARSEGIRWLVTTSRRTPPEAERRLQRALEPVSAFFVAYHREPQRVVLPFLGMAEKIFVTEESSSMIGEAVAARKPVYTLAEGLTDDWHYRKILEKLQNERRIVRVNPFDFSSDTRLPEGFQIPAEEYRDRLALTLEAWMRRNGISYKGKR